MTEDELKKAWNDAMTAPNPKYRLADEKTERLRMEFRRAVHDYIVLRFRHMTQVPRVTDDLCQCGAATTIVLGEAAAMMCPKCGEIRLPR